MSNFEHLLSRLEQLKRTGDGRYMARCPSHEDRTASLAIRELKDGRVLIHCFAGCNINEVLKAIGLTLSDLFPKRLEINEKSERRPFPAADVMRALAFEVSVVGIVAADISKKMTISPKTKDRLLLAIRRIQSGIDAGRLNHD